jgi:hypothetical protein
VRRAITFEYVQCLPFDHTILACFIQFLIRICDTSIVVVDFLDDSGQMFVFDGLEVICDELSIIGFLVLLYAELLSFFSLQLPYAFLDVSWCVVFLFYVVAACLLMLLWK